VVKARIASEVLNELVSTTSSLNLRQPLAAEEASLMKYDKAFFKRPDRPQTGLIESLRKESRAGRILIDTT